MFSIDSIDSIDIMEKFKKKIGEFIKDNKIEYFHFVNFDVFNSKFEGFYSYVNDTSEEFKEKYEKDLKDFVRKNGTLADIGKDKECEFVNSFYLWRESEENSNKENSEEEKFTDIKFTSMQMEKQIDSDVQVDDNDKWKNWIDLVKQLMNLKHHFTINIFFKLNDGKEYYSSIFLSSNNKNVFKNKEIEKKCYYLLIENLLNTIVPHVFKIKNKQEKSLKVNQILLEEISHNYDSHVSVRVTSENIQRRIGKMNEGLKEQEALNYECFLRDIHEKYRNDKGQFCIRTQQQAQSMRFMLDVMAPFIENTLLIDFIGSSEGINYQNNEESRLRIRIKYNEKDIYIKYYCVNKNSVLYSSKDGCLPYYRKTDNVVRKVEGDDFEVSIVHQHCLYSIFENYIRNASKHNAQKLNNGENLEIQINVTDENNAYLVEISDNISTISEEQLNEFKKCLEGGISEWTNNKGIFTFVINSSLLMEESVIEKSNHLSFECTKEGFLKVYFKIPKPKKMVFVDWDGEIKKNEGEKKGIFFKKSDENHSFNNFDFAILPEDKRDIWEKDKKKFPFRTIFIPREQDKPENIFDIEYCWKIWLEQRWGIKRCENKKSTHIIVLFNNTKLSWQDQENLKLLPFDILIINKGNGGKYLFSFNGSKLEEQECDRVGKYLEGKKIILYDRHSEISSNYLEGKFPSLRGDENAFFYLSGGNSDYWRITSCIAEESKLMPYKLMEAGVMRVLVVDERIKCGIFKKGDSNIPTKKGGLDLRVGQSTSAVYWAANAKIVKEFIINGISVMVRPDEPELDECMGTINIKENGEVFFEASIFCFEKYKKKLKEDGEDWVEEKKNLESVKCYCILNKEKEKYIKDKFIGNNDFKEKISLEFDAILIHRTFIKQEKIKSNEHKVTSEKFLKKLSKNARVILVSGGGDNCYQGDFLFVPFNQIKEKFKNDGVEKISLCNIINSARRVNNKI